MSKLNRAQRRLGMEQLESRCLLAGNVTATLRDGELTLRGDHQGNNVAVTPGPGGTVLVSDAGGTAINGRPGPFRFAVRKDIKIELAGGNDGLFVGNGLVAPRKLKINMGTGFDTAILDGVRSRDEAEIISNGDSIGDRIAVTNAQFPELEIKTGNGHDEVNLGGVEVDEELKIDTASGNDLVSLTEVVAEELEIKLGRGNDRLTLTRVFISDEAELDGGDNFDRLAIFNSAFDDLERKSFEA